MDEKKTCKGIKARYMVVPIVHIAQSMHKYSILLHYNNKVFYKVNMI